MKILVLSSRHHLLPIADRLAPHHEVTTIVLKDRYELCWNIRLDKALKGKEKSAEAFKVQINQIKEASGVIITDSNKMTQAALDAGCQTYGVLSSPPVAEVPNLILLGWFDGEHSSNLALAVPDWGLWPGGIGPFVLSGLTISRWKSAQLSVPLGPLIPNEQMKSGNFKGMFAVYLKFDTNGFSRVGYAGGWMPILAHAYLSQFSFTDFYMNIITDYMHTIAIPISVPPYPLECNYRGNSYALDGALMANPDIWLHDVTEVDDELKTAQTDGLLAIVTSSANRLTKARRDAYNLAAGIHVPQIQWRSDAGITAERMFDLLEDYGL